jgi:hypothetical protein
MGLEGEIFVLKPEGQVDSPDSCGYGPSCADRQHASILLPFRYGTGLVPLVASAAQDLTIAGTPGVVAILWAHGVSQAAPEANFPDALTYADTDAQTDGVEILDDNHKFVASGVQVEFGYPFINGAGNRREFHPNIGAWWDRILSAVADNTFLWFRHENSECSKNLGPLTFHPPMGGIVRPMGSVGMRSSLAYVPFFATDLFGGKGHWPARFELNIPRTLFLRPDALSPIGTENMLMPVRVAMIGREVCADYQGCSCDTEGVVAKVNAAMADFHGRIMADIDARLGAAGVGGMGGGKPSGRLR